jgi:uroporphyrinogen decarboxylase
MNETAHRLAPDVKTFIHTCGAIYDVVDYIIEGGFDILNPVQWTAGGHSFREWKAKCRGKIALWGGGVDTQKTLPLGTVADVEREVTEVVSCLAEGGGYVFNSIHNILAEVEPEKIVAMYRAAGAVRPG